MKRIRSRISERKSDGRAKRIPIQLIDLIEQERCNLGKVETALEVLIIALVHQDAESGDRPYYANLVELALEPLKRSLERLDTVRLDRAMATG